RLHAVALLFCAFMGGLSSRHLRTMKDRLAEANRELQAINTQLSMSLGENERRGVEQEAALALLRDSEERYRRLLERIQDGVLIVQDGCIRYCNRVFADMVADTPPGLLGAEVK